jgi:hypothetical protein
VQTVLQLRLPLWRKSSELGIVLQSAVLLLRRQILVIAQPISGMTRPIARGLIARLLVALRLIAWRLLASAPSIGLGVFLLGTGCGSWPA